MSAKLVLNIELSECLVCVNSYCFLCIEAATVSFKIFQNQTPSSVCLTSNNMVQIMETVLYTFFEFLSVNPPEKLYFLVCFRIGRL